MSATTTAPLVDKKFGPGHAAYLKTRGDLPAEAVWGALKDFTAERPKLCPSSSRRCTRYTRSASATRR
jgi:hypothetical protein